MKNKQGVDLSDKSLYFGNVRGEAMPLSVEAALSRNLTDFRGWHCALGVENLHISPDGATYGAACRNSGHLGNVYEQMFDGPKVWHQCTRAMCSCGADMQLRKVKELKYIDETYKDMPDNLVDTIENPVLVAPVHQFAHRTHPLTLTWDLGRRCNYSCSYCSAEISNNYEAHKTWGSLQFAYNGLEKNFLKGKKAKFVFTGGEPTVNPAYLDFVKHLSERGHLVHTTTNGSRLPEYYGELIEISFLGFSYHLEFTNLERFSKVIEAIIAKKESNERARQNWCGVRIMVPPGRLAEAVSAREAMLNLTGLVEQGVKIFMSPLYDPIHHVTLLPYPPGELERISELA